MIKWRPILESAQDSVEREDMSESLQEKEQKSPSTDELSEDESSYCDLNTSTTSSSSCSLEGPWKDSDTFQESLKSLTEYQTNYKKH